MKSVISVLANKECSMYDEAYLAECHLVYCESASSEALKSKKYFLSVFYDEVKLYWSVMYNTHGGY